MSCRRITRPLSAVLITSWAKSAARATESLAMIAVVVLPSIRKPVGEVTLAARTALRRSSAVRPSAFIRRRLTSTRTAGVDAPAISTEDTPVIWRMRWASNESATL